MSRVVEGRRRRRDLEEKHRRLNQGRSYNARRTQHDDSMASRSDATRVIEAWATSRGRMSTTLTGGNTTFSPLDESTTNDETLMTGAGDRIWTSEMHSGVNVPSLLSEHVDKPLREELGDDSTSRTMSESSWRKLRRKLVGDLLRRLGVPSTKFDVRRAMSFITLDRDGDGKRTVCHTDIADWLHSDTHIL